MALTALADIIVPRVFTEYTQILTEEKSRLIQSGALARDPVMDQLLSGGGKTFDLPSWDDLDNGDENISTADVTTSTPGNIGSQQEVSIRLSRNNSWGSYDLLRNLAGSDPLEAIERRVSNYWALRLQKLFVATMRGISRDNGVNDAGDYSEDIAGAAFVAGVTNFSAEAFLDAAQTMGDSSEDLRMVMVHSVVMARMKKNNLIDFIPDSRGEVDIPTFQGAEVIVDDGMPSGTLSTRGDGTDGVTGIYETWMFGPAAMRLGVGSAKVPTEVDRSPAAGTGGGAETLHSRVEWMMGPRGHAYTGTGSSEGGPPNVAADDVLGAINREASWDRVYPERKQIKLARLITRES